MNRWLVEKACKNKFPFYEARHVNERNNTWRRREEEEKIWQIDRVDEKETWLAGAQQVLNST